MKTQNIKRDGGYVSVESVRAWMTKVSNYTQSNPFHYVSPFGNSKNINRFNTPDNMHEKFARTKYNFVITKNDFVKTKTELFYSKRRAIFNSAGDGLGLKRR